MSSLTRNNVQHHCRTCLTYLGPNREDQPQVLRYHLKTTENLAEWIENFTSLRVLTASNDYPQFVCGRCYGMFKGFKEYQLLTLCASARLTALLENTQQEYSENKTESNPTKDDTSGLLCENYNEVEMEEEFISLNTKSGKQPIEEISEATGVNLDINALKISMDSVKEYKLDENESNSLKHSVKLSCRFCHLRFSRRQQLISHERVHTGEKPYSCEICHNRYRHSASLRRHRREYNCNPLPQEEIQNKSLQNQTEDAISTAELQFETCNKLNFKMEFESADTEPCYENIKDRSEPDDGKAMVTFTTNNVSSSTSDTKVIISRKINNLVNELQCNMCQRYFSCTSTLKIHISSMHKGLRPYACKYCKSCFALKYSLKRHEQIHTGEKPFACEICGRKFAYSWNMETHRQRHKVNSTKKNSPPKNKKIRDGNSRRNCNINSMEMTHRCHICQKVFSYKCRLEAHIITVHKGIRPFNCPFCHLSFSSKYYLKEHEYTHTGEKPFACDICGRRFRQHQVLRIHKKRHQNKTSMGK